MAARTGEQLLFQDMGLPEFRKPLSEWTPAQCEAMYLLMRIVIEQLDLDPDTGVKTVWARMYEALKVGEFDVNDFFPTLCALADKRRGGRIQ